MEQGCIDEHGNECPHFFRVPTPVSSPRDVCPYCADKDADSEAEDGRIEQNMTDDLQSSDGVVNRGVAIPYFIYYMEYDCCQAIEHDECKETIGNHDDGDMDGEQR